jgi:hypothetical protein
VPLDSAGVLGAEGGAHDAGVHGVGRDRGGREPAGEFVGEQDVRELGLVVRPCTGVGAFALQVVELDAAHGMRVGGDGDHPGRGAVPQPVQEQVGEQERREMVECERALEPVGGDVPAVPVSADVIDQHIEPGEALEDRTGQSPDLDLGGQVRDEDVDVPLAGGTDLGGRVLGASSVPAGDRQVGAHCGQSQRGRPADATGAAGDQHGLAGHRPAAGRCCHGFILGPVAHGMPGAQTVMASLPRASPASRCRMASDTRSSGYVSSTLGVT